MSEQEERIISNMREQHRIYDETVARELKIQKKTWDKYIQGQILSLFYANELETGFFAFRDNLRKRTNLSFDENIFLKAPNNIVLRMPVALKKKDCGYIVYDLQGSMPISIKKLPEYDLAEDRIFIMKMVKHYPAYPLRPVLNETQNGISFSLSPTTLPLHVSMAGTEFEPLLHYSPASESVGIDTLTALLNWYRLNDFIVERAGEMTIIVTHPENKESFLIIYDIGEKKLKVAILQNKEVTDQNE